MYICAMCVKMRKISLFPLLCVKRAITFLIANVSIRWRSLSERRGDVVVSVYPAINRFVYFWF